MRMVRVCVEAGFENSSGDFDMDIGGWETGDEDNGGKAE